MSHTRAFRSRIAPSLWAAGVVFAVGYAEFVLSNIEGVLYMQARTNQSIDVLGYAGPVVGFALEHGLWLFIPLAIGAFVSFWLIAPMRGDLSLFGAVGRSLVAVVIGVTLSVIFYAVRIVAADALEGTGRGAGADGSDPRLQLLIAGTILHQAWQMLSSTFAVVTAAGLGLWGWLKMRGIPAAVAPVSTAHARADGV